MKIQVAAEATRKKINLRMNAYRDNSCPEGTDLNHIVWMMLEIEGGNIKGEKAHRWLGYAQGVAVERGWLTLEQAKNINKEA